MNQKKQQENQINDFLAVFCFLSDFKSARPSKPLFLTLFFETKKEADLASCVVTPKS